MFHLAELLLFSLLHISFFLRFKILMILLSINFGRTITAFRKGGHLATGQPHLLTKVKGSVSNWLTDYLKLQNTN